MNKVANVQVPAVQSASPTKVPILAGGNVTAIVPKSIDDAFRVAEAICLSGMVPDSYKGRDNRETASKVMVGIMKGMEVGLPPITALANIYIVNNRPTIWGDAALALVQHHAEYGGCQERVEGKPETDDYTAYCEITRKTIGGDSVTTKRQFSWSDAKRAALVNKGPWRQYPQRMLQMRARAWCIRDSFADALSGLQIREEIEDIHVKPETVPTDFLDAGTQSVALAPQNETHADDQAAADPEIDPVAMLDGIKRGFLAAGDDVEKIQQTVDAAEGIELPEPQAAELAEIIAGKKKKLAK